MTIQEAVELIEYMNIALKLDCDSAVIMKKNLQSVKEVAKKQIPKKPISFKRTAHDFQTGFCKHSGIYCEYIKPYSNEYKYTDYKCPCCKHLISDGTPSYCWNCGQALDWSKLIMNKDEIEKEIKRLENAADRALKNACGVMDLIRLICSEEPRVAGSGRVTRRLPVFYDYNRNHCFTLTEDDLQAIFDSRMKRYNELKEKLKEASNDEIIHRCGDFTFIDTDCKDCVDEDETFSEVGGCENFIKKEE